MFWLVQTWRSSATCPDTFVNVYVKTTSNSVGPGVGGGVGVGAPVGVAGAGHTGVGLGVGVCGGVGVGVPPVVHVGRLKTAGPITTLLARHSAQITGAGGSLAYTMLKVSPVSTQAALHVTSRWLKNVPVGGGHPGALVNEHTWIGPLKSA
jgi:hypothetical protein